MFLADGPHGLRKQAGAADQLGLKNIISYGGCYAKIYSIPNFIYTNFLTFLFILNTILSGVTNSQVQLSTSLISDAFVSLEYQQVKLAKGIDKIDLNVQTYLSGNETNTSEEISKAIIGTVDQTDDIVTEIADICDLFSKKAMNSALRDSYEPYELNMKAFLKQAAVMAENIRKNDKSATENSFSEYKHLSNLMLNSESNFQKVLDGCISHETSLIHSRVTRSTVIIWIMAAFFIISAALAFYLSIMTIIKPLKEVNRSLNNIICKLEEDEGDLTVRIACQSEDEIGQMAKGINHFIEILQHAMLSIKSGSNMIHFSTEKHK